MVIHYRSVPTRRARLASPRPFTLPSCLRLLPSNLLLRTAPDGLHNRNVAFDNRDGLKELYFEVLAVILAVFRATFSSPPTKSHLRAITYR